ncbi:MAG TPA: SDR family NAD(P)-dependent oxidoreductase [Kutzneria sp.]|jgi:NAD(P)-dependent dehydrogenase (short-subunit alcohol dehydrogenase family)
MFGWETTADQAIAGIRLDGRRAVVTGASSGIGFETARVLAAAGAEVTLAVRDREAGNRAAAQVPGAKVAVLDLADLASVAAFTDAWTGPLHLLINNAGVMALPTRQLSPAGWEMHFATNHLGHFALATGLHGALAAAGGARIVSLTSRGHLRSAVDFDDVNFDARPYDPLIAYGQSKTANILFAVEAGRLWAGDGISANAVHPGGIMDTNLSRHMPPEVLEAAKATSHQVLKTLGQGAATSIVVATSPELDGVTGAYFEDCQPSEPIGPDDGDILSHPRGVAWYALDPDNAARLWQLSAKAVAR